MNWITPDSIMDRFDLYGVPFPPLELQVGMELEIIAQDGWEKVKVTDDPLLDGKPVGSPEEDVPWLTEDVASILGAASIRIEAQLMTVRLGLEEGKLTKELVADINTLHEASGAMRSAIRSAIALQQLRNSFKPGGD